MQLAELLNKEMIRQSNTSDLLDSKTEECNKLKEKISQIEKTVNDNTIAEEPLKVCGASGHDSRWCAYCSARRDGIDSYQVLLIDKVKAIISK